MKREKELSKLLALILVVVLLLIGTQFATFTETEASHAGISSSIAVSDYTEKEVCTHKCGTDCGDIRTFREWKEGDDVDTVGVFKTNELTPQTDGFLLDTNSSLGLLANLLPQYTGPTGSKFIADPSGPLTHGSIPISNRAQLELIGNHQNYPLSGNYHLENDINLDPNLSGGKEWVPIGTNDDPFTGIFNGQGYVIRNLSITEITSSSVGLFGAICNSEIKNVGLGGSINAMDYPHGFPSFVNIGGIVAISSSSIISNCYNAAEINMSFVFADYYTFSKRTRLGGIVASSSLDTISNCYNVGDISSYVSINYLGVSIECNVGGIVARLSPGNISNCYNIGNIVCSTSARIGSYSSAGGVAGAVGSHIGSDINNCFNTGDIELSSISLASGSSPNLIQSASYAGGIAGECANVMISNCSNSGNILSSSSSLINGSAHGGSGGIIGISAGGFTIGNSGSVTINNCYNIGNVSNNSESAMGSYASFTGGLIGEGSRLNLIINNSYWRIESDQIVNKSPLECSEKRGVGRADDTKTGRLTDEQMRDYKNYDKNYWGFNFVSTWGFNDKDSYPVLREFYQEFPTLLVITTPSLLPEGITVTQYSYRIQASIDFDVNWYLVGSSRLPTGLTLSEQGVISGMPTSSGIFNFIIRATSGVDSDTKEFSIKIGDPPPAGATVSGTVKTYNLGNVTTFELHKNGEMKYSKTIPTVAGSGQIAQDFRIENVAPGTYTLVILKAVHTRFYVENIVVGDSDVDLTQDSREAVQLMTLLCGDINGDGWINVGDLNTMLSSNNYMRRTIEAVNGAADLNGDGWINVGDLNILLSANNYMQGEVVIR